MPYASNLFDAANRHFIDGRKLLDDRRFDNAGYHFGLAAECAIKRQLELCGVRHDDPSIWTHWPDLRQLALDAVHGRSASGVRTLLAHPGFMQEWSIKMRYALTGSIEIRLAERWREQANQAMGLLL